MNAASLTQLIFVTMTMTPIKVTINQVQLEFRHNENKLIFIVPKFSDFRFTFIFQ